MAIRAVAGIVQIKAHVVLTAVFVLDDAEKRTTVKMLQGQRTSLYYIFQQFTLYT